MRTMWADGASRSVIVESDGIGEGDSMIEEDRCDPMTWWYGPADTGWKKLHRAVLQNAARALSRPCRCQGYGRCGRCEALAWVCTERVQTPDDTHADYLTFEQVCGMLRLDEAGVRRGLVALAHAPQRMRRVQIAEIRPRTIGARHV